MCSSGATVALIPLFTKSATSFCNAASAPFPADIACATTNNTTFAPPWPYTASGGGTTYAVGAFYEGGIDLTGLYQALNKPLPCVSQFLAVMGSSSATTGTNKDFAGGGFDLCSKILIDKETVPAGDPAQFNFTITGGPDSINVPVNGLTDASAPAGTGQVKPGTYTLTEAPSANWTNTGVTCKDQGNVSVPISNGQVAVGPGRRDVQVRQRQEGPADAEQAVHRRACIAAGQPLHQAGRTVINAGAGQKLDAANGQGTGAQAVAPGTFDLSETAGTNTDFANYSSTWDCTKNGAAFIPSTPGIAGSVAVGAGENVVCTFHNSFNNFNPTVDDAGVG